MEPGEDENFRILVFINTFLIKNILFFINRKTSEEKKVPKRHQTFPEQL